MSDKIVCSRTEFGAIIVGVEHKIVRHSPTGMEFGYGGSGPSDLALNILAQWYGEKIANENYQEFKFAFIATMPREGGEIYKANIDKWISDRNYLSQQAKECHEQVVEKATNPFPTADVDIVKENYYTGVNKPGTGI